MGMGSVALAWLLQQEKLLAAPHMPRENRSIRPDRQAAARAAAGPGHDLAVHARRAEPRRPARPQARADRSAAAPTIRARSSTASSTGPARSCSAVRGSSPSTASAAPKCRSCCRTLPASSTTSPSIRSMHTGINGHESSIWYLNTGKSQPGRPALGSLAHLRPGLREPGPAGLRRAVRSRRTSGRRRAQLVERLDAAAVSGHGPPPAGAADPQPRSAGASARRAAAAEPGAAGRLESRSIWSGIRARPTWKRASPATNWPRACRPPPRKRSTFRARARRPRSCTASTSRPRPSTARAA